MDYDWGDDCEKQSRSAHLCRANSRMVPQFLVTVSMVDEDGTYAIGQLATTVRNSSPEIDRLEGDVSGDEGCQFHFSATAHDPAGDADTLTYVWFFGDGSDHVSGVGLTRSTTALPTAVTTASP